MKALFVVLVLLVAGIAGLGLYRGWFSFASDSADAKSNITFSVDKEKMHEDEKKVMTKVQGIGHEGKEKAAATGEKSTDGTVVRVSSDELTMTTKAGKEKGQTLVADVKVTCDVQACKAADLKAGMRIRVTTDNDAPYAATRIEALDKDAAF